MPEQELPQQNIQSHNKIFFAILIAVLVMFIVGGGIYFLTRAMTTTQSTPIPSEKTAAGDTLVPSEKDSDSDGLSDAEEKKYGTDLQKRDTDGDGLTDGEEVRATKTDPRNAHSKYPILTDLQWILKNKSTR